MLQTNQPIWTQLRVPCLVTTTATSTSAISSYDSASFLRGLISPSY